LANIVAFSRHETILNRVGLLWGVRPLHGDWVQGVAGVVEQTERKLLENKLASPGDNIAITFGMVMGDEPLQTNVLKLYKLKGQ
jgi:pyruvate kinase